MFRLSNTRTPPASTKPAGLPLRRDGCLWPRGALPEVLECLDLDGGCPAAAESLAVVGIDHRAARLAQPGRKHVVGDRVQVLERRAGLRAWLATLDPERVQARH